MALIFVKISGNLIVSNQKAKTFRAMGKKMRLDRGQIEMVDDAMAEVLRRKTPAERIKIGFNIWTSARRMLISHLKSTHPWNSEQIQNEVARRFLHGAL